MPVDPNLATALQFVAKDNNRAKLKIVIAEFQKGLPDANNQIVPGSPDQATVKSAIPPLHSLKPTEWSEWTDGVNGPNQIIILKLLQQLSLLNYGNPVGDPSNGGEVSDKT